MPMRVTGSAGMKRQRTAFDWFVLAGVLVNLAVIAVILGNWLVR